MSKTIIALAALKANWEERKRTHIDNFNLLLVECLRISKEKFASSPLIQKNFEDNFGLFLPIRIIDELIKRASKTGFLKKENRIYIVNKEKVDTNTFKEKQREFNTEYDELLEALIQYAKTKYNFDLTEDTAENILHNYISENTIEMAHVTAESSLIKISRASKKQEKYIFASFVNHIVEKNSSTLDSLSKIVEGVMLADAIFYQDPTKIKSKFKNTCVYFDAPFLITALGYRGESLRDPYVELLKELWSSGADLCCFSHSVNEIKTILKKSSESIGKISSKTEYENMDKYFIRNNYNETSILLLRSRLVKSLEAININNITTKIIKGKKFLKCNNVVKEFFKKNTFYSNPKAMYRDISSITSIICLRNGNVPDSLEKSGFIFITTNMGLVHAGNNYLKTAGLKGSYPIALFARDLESIYWGKNPSNMPNLPKKRIISDCYAAVQPDANFSRAFFKEIEKLEDEDNISSDDVFTLRQDLESLQIAMELTTGDEGAITRATVEEILKIRNDDIIRQEKEKRLESESRENILKDTLFGLKEDRVKRKLIIEYKINKIAKYLSSITLLTITLLFAYGYYIIGPHFSESNYSKLIQFLVYVIISSAGIYGMYSKKPLFFSIKRKLIIKYENGITNIFNKISFWVSGKG